MAAAAIQNPAVRSESKSSKKKKAKAESVASSTPATTPAVAEPAPESNNGDGAYESPYLKELYKNIRNVNKKISNTAKVELLIAEHPDLSLDDLVKTRKINNDQKAQILKKPSLQAYLNQLEEQVAQYKKIDQEYKDQSQADKAELEKSLNEQHKKELDEAVSAAKSEAAEQSLKEQQQNMLVLSKYLRLVAARRAEEDADTSSDEHEALEGVLLAVYTGDESAVSTMLKLTQGSDEKCYSVNGVQLQTTYAQVKEAALAWGAPGATETEESIPTETITTDPTMANAGLTEIDDPTLQTLSNGHVDSPSDEAAGPLQNASAGDEAANATAEASWDQTNNDLSASQEWVEVPREAAETDTGVVATPAANSNIQSWADEQPETSAPEKATTTPVTPAPANDGFSEVRHRGGRDNRGRGGRGGEGGYRGRGRGDGYRGRGRGGPPRGTGPRPQRRNDNA